MEFDQPSRVIGANPVAKSNDGGLAEVNHFSDIILSVCSRPQMYVGSHSFKLACTWLDGYIWAISEGNHEAKLSWNSFTEWLAIRLDYPKNHIWSSQLSRLYPNDEIAFEQLHLLYSQFCTDFNEVNKRIDTAF